MAVVFKAEIYILKPDRPTDDVCVTCGYRGCRWWRCGVDNTDFCFGCHRQEEVQVSFISNLHGYYTNYDEQCSFVYILPLIQTSLTHYILSSYVACVVD